MQFEQWKHYILSKHGSFCLKSEVHNVILGCQRSKSWQHRPWKIRYFEVSSSRHDSFISWSSKEFKTASHERVSVSSFQVHWCKIRWSWTCFRGIKGKHFLSSGWVYTSTSTFWEIEKFYQIVSAPCNLITHTRWVPKSFYFYNVRPANNKKYTIQSLQGEVIP